MFTWLTPAVAATLIAGGFFGWSILSRSMDIADRPEGEPGKFLDKHFTMIALIIVAVIFLILSGRRGQS